MEKTEIYYGIGFITGTFKTEIIKASEYFNSKRKKGDVDVTYFITTDNEKIDVTNLCIQRVDNMSVHRRLELGYYRNNKTEPTYTVKQKTISDTVDDFIINNIPNNSSVKDLKTFLNGVIKDREQVAELNFSNIEKDYIQENNNLLAKFKTDLEKEFKTDSNPKKDTLWYKILNKIDDNCEIDVSEFNIIYEEYCNLSDLLV